MRVIEPLVFLETTVEQTLDQLPLLAAAGGAHCDALDGPVVNDARAALAEHLDEGVRRRFERDQIGEGVHQRYQALVRELGGGRPASQADRQSRSLNDRQDN